MTKENMTVKHNTATLPRLVDSKQMATHLSVNERHIRRLVAERRIPFVKWGHLIRFDPAVVVKWLNDATVEATEPRRFW